MQNNNGILIPAGTGVVNYKDMNVKAENEEEYTLSDSENILNAEDIVE